MEAIAVDMDNTSSGPFIKFKQSKSGSSGYTNSHRTVTEIGVLNFTGNGIGGIGTLKKGQGLIIGRGLGHGLRIGLREGLGPRKKFT